MIITSGDAVYKMDYNKVLEYHIEKKADITVVCKEMPEGTDGEKAKKAEIRKVQEVYYKKAFDGFQAAVAGENFPICGMDSYTLDYLMACLACHFKEYYFASKAISNILSSQTVDRRMKDKALDLKYEILEGIKKADS